MKYSLNVSIVHVYSVVKAKLYVLCYFRVMQLTEQGHIFYWLSNIVYLCGRTKLKLLEDNPYVLVWAWNILFILNNIQLRGFNFHYFNDEDVGRTACTFSFILRSPDEVCVWDCQLGTLLFYCYVR